MIPCFLFTRSIAGCLPALVSVHRHMHSCSGQLGCSAWVPISSRRPTDTANTKFCVQILRFLENPGSTCLGPERNATVSSAVEKLEREVEEEYGGWTAVNKLIVRGMNDASALAGGH